MQNYKNLVGIYNFDDVCHIKHDHLVNVYISLEKHEKCDISATVRLISTKFKFNVKTQIMSLKRLADKNYNF